MKRSYAAIFPRYLDMGSVSEQWEMRGFVVPGLRLEVGYFVFRVAASGGVGYGHLHGCRDCHRSYTSSSCLQYVMDLQLSDLLDGLDHNHKHTIYLPSKSIIYLPIDGGNPRLHTLCLRTPTLALT